MKSNSKMLNFRSIQGENMTPSLEASPMRPGTTMANSTAKKRRPRMSTGNQHGNSQTGEKEHVELSSPTSISMKNSYIIKNADPSFDAYYKSMNRRSKLISQNTMGGGTIQMGQDKTLSTIAEG